MRIFFSIILLILCNSCFQNPEKHQEKILHLQVDTLSIIQPGVSDTVQEVRSYDVSTVEEKERKEFNENLKKIEKVHGVQWDFCTCVVKNDSINRAVQRNDLSEEQFERLFARLDEIERKCKAFLVQSPNITPDERSIHQKKVSQCLSDHSEE